MRLRALAVLALVLSGCGGDEAAVPPAPEPGPVHIHGLGVNPADGALFIATHTGLWRAPAGSTKASRVGDSRQDTMGFTVVGPDHFLGSGHPDLRELQEGNLPPHLGLIESRDGGRSWTNVSLLGEADFHVLRADGRRVLGLNATRGRLMLSADGGRSWRSPGTQVPFFDVVAAPGDEEVLVAGAEDGVYRSDDAGATWRRVGRAAGLLAWPASDTLYHVAADGTMSASDDGARSFTVRGTIGMPGVFVAIDRITLYVALHDGTVHVSRDGGRTWSLRSGA